MLYCWFTPAFLLILTAGCAGTIQDVTALSPGQPSPTERPMTLVLGEIEITDTNVMAADREIYRLKFQEGVEAWFAKANTFNTVLTGTNVPPHGIILSGTITDVDKGSAAKRYWVGWGSGAERIQGKFEIKDVAGQRLTWFTAQRSYLGGVGFGGSGMVSMEELTSRLGDTVAETISKWLQGQPIN